MSTYKKKYKYIKVYLIYKNKMINLTIGTVSFFGKDYNKLIIQNITTITGTNSITTSIPFYITNTLLYNPNNSGYKDTIVLNNPESIAHDYLTNELLNILGLTQS